MRKIAVLSNIETAAKRPRGMGVALKFNQPSLQAHYE
jgi:hypothetical protein